MAAEMSNTVGQEDVDRARASADALARVFVHGEAVAVTVGHGISRLDLEHASDAGVTYLELTRAGPGGSARAGSAAIDLKGGGFDASPLFLFPARCVQVGAAAQYTIRGGRS